VAESLRREHARGLGKRRRREEDDDRKTSRVWLWRYVKLAGGVTVRPGQRESPNCGQVARICQWTYRDLCDELSLKVQCRRYGWTAETFRVGFVVFLFYSLEQQRLPTVFVVSIQSAVLERWSSTRKEPGAQLQMCFYFSCEVDKSA
jgi:hypothetical protein